MSTQASSSGGLGLFSVLGIIFVVLKLVGVISWSWWWVLLPLYGPVALLIAFILLAVLVAAAKS